MSDILVQSPSCVWLCNPMDCSMPDLPVPHHFPKFIAGPLHRSSCPLHQWCHPAISSSDSLFSICPQSFLASRTLPMSQLFSSDNQYTGASASFFPTSIQGWFSLRLTGLISVLSKGLSGVFSNTMVQRHQFFGVLPSLHPSFHNSTWPLGIP